MTEYEAIRVGVVLRSIVQRDEFDLVMDLLRKDYMNRIVTTGPHERDKRERLYDQYHALDDLVGGLEFFMSKAEDTIFTAPAEDEF